MTAPDDVALARVWASVAAEAWRRHPGWLERTVTRLLRSPGLARALLTTPSLLLPWLNDPGPLLFDEPTAGLDPEQRVAFRALMRDFGEHATVIVSTHLATVRGSVVGSASARAVSLRFIPNGRGVPPVWTVPRPVTSRSRTPRTARGPRSRSACTRHSAPTCRPSRDRTPHADPGAAGRDNRADGQGRLNARGVPQEDNSNGQPVGPSSAKIAAAAARFEAPSPAARHAWLATHLPALRAGTITLASCRDRRRGQEPGRGPGWAGPGGPRRASAWSGCTCAAAAPRAPCSRWPPRSANSSQGSVPSRAGSSSYAGSVAAELRAPAQQAVAFGLLKAAGIALLTPTQAAAGTGPADGVPGPAPGSQVFAAAACFAALPAAERHDWLLTHLTGLRAGHISLSQIP